MGSRDDQGAEDARADLELVRNCSKNYANASFPAISEILI